MVKVFLTHFLVFVTAADSIVKLSFFTSCFKKNPIINERGNKRYSENGKKPVSTCVTNQKEFCEKEEQSNSRVKIFVTSSLYDYYKNASFQDFPFYFFIQLPPHIFFEIFETLSSYLCMCWWNFLYSSHSFEILSTQIYF